MGYSKSGVKLTHRWPGCPGAGPLPRRGRRSVTVPCGQPTTLPSGQSPFAFPQRDCRPEILSILELRNALEVGNVVSVNDHLSCVETVLRNSTGELL